MNMILSWLVLSLVISASASARMEKFVPNPDCPKFGTMYIRDDVTGLQYIHVTDCQGHSCLYPFTGPMPPPRVLALPIDVPTNLYPDLVSNAATISTPNTDVGIYYVDANGEITRFRTFANNDESAYYWGLWENESGGATLGQAEAVGPSEIEPVIFATAREGALAFHAQNRALDALAGTERSVESELLGTYLKGELGDGGLERSPNWAAIGKVTSHLFTHKSGLRITSVSGAGTISFEPVADAFAGPISVVASDGRVVWRGDCTGPTFVDMAGHPSGLYFVAGSGRSLVFGISR